MIKTNNIDIFLLNEELLNIFHSLIDQFKNKDFIYNCSFNLTNKLSKKNLNLITILDEASLSYLISEKFVLNNYIFVIGKINERTENYLNSNFIDYECFETPISFLNIINRCDNLLNEINNAYSEIVTLKSFSYSFALKTIYTKKSSLYLTDKENEIFQFLIKSLETAISKKLLLSKVWSYSDDIDTHTLETHIYTLRKKIKTKLDLDSLILHTDDGYIIKD